MLVFRVFFLAEAEEHGLQTGVPIKILRITWTRFAIRQKLTTLGIICVWTYKKVGRVIWLESKSNTSILDEYGKY